MRRFGLSVWAPISRNGASGPAPSGTTQATRAPARAVYQRPPPPGHWSAASRLLNPAASSRREASATAW